MSAIRRLGEVSRAYEIAADEYKAIALRAAHAEAAHKSTRARTILQIKARETERISHAEAEARADADEEISNLYRDRLITAALQDSHREKLRQLREQVATGRTAVASDRVVDQMHAQGITGAA